MAWRCYAKGRGIAADILLPFFWAKDSSGKPGALARPQIVLLEMVFFTTKVFYHKGHEDFSQRARRFLVGSVFYQKDFYQKDFWH